MKSKQTVTNTEIHLQSEAEEETISLAQPNQFLLV